MPVVSSGHGRSFTTGPVAQRRGLDDDPRAVRRRTAGVAYLSCGDAPFTLEFEDGERVEVTPLAPVSFAGDRATFCRLHGEGARALNVMTLRSAYRHEVRVANGEIEVSICACSE